MPMRLRNAVCKAHADLRTAAGFGRPRKEQVQVVGEAGLESRFTIAQVIDPFPLEGFIVSQIQQPIALLFKSAAPAAPVNAKARSHAVVMPFFSKGIQIRKNARTHDAPEVRADSSNSFEIWCMLEPIVLVPMGKPLTIIATIKRVSVP